MFGGNLYTCRLHHSKDKKQKNNKNLKFSQAKQYLYKIFQIFKLFYKNMDAVTKTSLFNHPKIQRAKDVFLTSGQNIV